MAEISNPNSNSGATGSPSLMAIPGTAENRLQVYANRFVTRFVRKYEKANDLAIPGNKANTDSLDKNLQEIEKRLKDVCLHVAFVPTRMVAGAVYKNYIKSKAKKISRNPYDPHEFRRMSTELACEIFQHFEYQFMKIQNSEGNWQHGMTRMARYTVSVLLRRLATVKSDSSIEDIKQFLIKEFIEPSSNINIIKASKVRFNGKKSKIPQIFKGLGLRITKDDKNGDKYFRKREGDKSTNFGYRLKFAFEAEEMIIRSYQEEKVLLEESYAHILSAFSVSDLVKMVKFDEQTPTDDTESISFNETDAIEPFTERRGYLSKLHEMLQEKRTNVRSGITCIIGAPGVGKTELVRKYVQEYRRYYDNNILWIDAESATTLDENFRELAIKLEIPTEENQTVERVYNFWRNGKCLFIYDNACDAEELSKFLPKSINVARNAHVLVISIDQDFLGSSSPKKLTLKPFTKDEAKDFIKSKQINIENDPSIGRLIDTLDYLPLALNQAVEYMRQEEINNVFMPMCTVNDYLNLYKIKTERLINYETENNCNYNRTLFITYSLLIKKIRSMSKSVNEILEIIAYLNASCIPLQLFLPETEQAISLLKKYSIVTIKRDKKILQVFKIVQEITKIYAKEENKVTEILQRICELIENCVASYSNDICLKLLLRPNIQLLIQYLDELPSPSNIKNKIAINTNLKKILLECFTNCNISPVSPEDQIELLRKHYENMKSIYGENDIHFARVLENLAINYHQLKKYVKQESLLKKSSELKKAFYGSEHIEVFKTMLKLSGALCQTGKYEESRKMQEEVLRRFESEYGISSYEVGVALNNVSNTYHGLRLYKEEVECLKRALKILEDILGADHILVCAVLISLKGAYESLHDEENASLIENLIEKHPYRKNELFE